MSPRSGFSPHFRSNISSIWQGFPGPRGEKGDRSERGEKVRKKGDGARSRWGGGCWGQELQSLVAAGPWGISLGGSEGIPNLATIATPLFPSYAGRTRGSWPERSQGPEGRARPTGP